MDRRPTEPLTTAEAKINLRLAADRISPERWVRQRTGEAAVVALVGGVIVGSSPNVRRLLTRMLVHYINRL